MSDTPQAKLFYGYLQPESDREERKASCLECILEGVVDFDTPWSAIPAQVSHDCVGDIYGYDENLGYFLAVEESLHEVEWDETKRLSQKDFEIQPTWNEDLRLAAKEFKLDLTGLEPGWYLVSLYF